MGFITLGFITGESICGAIIASGEAKDIFNCGELGGVTVGNCKLGTLLFIVFGLILALTVISAVGS